MNVEAENLDSLRKLVRELQNEKNVYLKEQLKKANISFQDINVFEEKIENTVEYDPDQGERIISRFITENMANQFFAMFWGRTDVYAKRGKNGGYFPQCDNRWHGGMNLLGKEDVWDNLIRIKSASVAAELLELSLGEK